MLKTNTKAYVYQLKSDIDVTVYESDSEFKAFYGYKDQPKVMVCSKQKDKTTLDDFVEFVDDVIVSTDFLRRTYSKVLGKIND